MRKVKQGKRRDEMRWDSFKASVRRVATHAASVHNSSHLHLRKCPFVFIFVFSKMDIATVGHFIIATSPIFKAQRQPTPQCRTYSSKTRQVYLTPPPKYCSLYQHPSPLTLLSIPRNPSFSPHFLRDKFAHGATMTLREKRHHRGV